jgi:hypothetical protein
VESAEQGNSSRADIAQSFRSMSGQVQRWQRRQKDPILIIYKHPVEYIYFNCISSIPLFGIFNHIILELTFSG